MITVSAQRELLWKAKCQQQQVWLTAFPGTKLKANYVQELSSKNHTPCKFSIRALLWKPTLVSSLQVCAAQYSTPGDWLAGDALFISEELDMFPLGVRYILLLQVVSLTGSHTHLSYCHFYPRFKIWISFNILMPIFKSLFFECWQKMFWRLKSGCVRTRIWA